MKPSTLLAGLVACSSLAIPTMVRAAAQPPCTPATMTPTASAIPANLPGFGYNALKATTSDVHLFATGPGPRTEVPVTLGGVSGGLLQIKAPLVAGTAYELEYSAFCNYGAYPAKPLTFVATAEAPLPTKIGDALTAPTVALKDYGTTQYTITASYSIASEMKPWRQVYQLGVALDGKLVDTKPTFDATGDSVQIVATGWCSEGNAATKKHTIGLRGTLPFAPVIETASADLEFDCPAPKFSTPGSNPPVQPAPGATTPTGGTSPASSTGNTGGSAGGCSVGSTYLSSSSPTSFLLFVGAVFAVMALIRRVVNDASAGANRK